MFKFRSVWWQNLYVAFSLSPISYITGLEENFLDSESNLFFKLSTETEVQRDKYTVSDWQGLETRSADSQHRLFPLPGDGLKPHLSSQEAEELWSRGVSGF